LRCKGTAFFVIGQQSCKKNEKYFAFR